MESRSDGYVAPEEGGLRRRAAPYDHRQPGCVFCNEIGDRMIDKHPLAVTIRDAYPITDLHTLVLPRRHVVSYGDLTPSEIIALYELTQRARTAIQECDPTVTAFNLGVNDGEDAGQTVLHAHLHVVPRRRGDGTDPAGAIRVTFPEQRDYRPETT